MDLSNNMLVALMFVTILTMSVSGILGFFADQIRNNDFKNYDPTAFVWAIILFLDSLLIFWKSTTILRVEDWDFLEFLLMIAGPIILFITVTLLGKITITVFSGATSNLVENNRFFELLVALHLWFLAVQWSFDLKMDWSTLSGALLVAAVLVARMKSTIMMNRIALAVSALSVLFGIGFSGYSALQ